MPKNHKKESFPKLYIVDSTKRGRGVYTSVYFKPGDLIEVCPVIVCPPKDLPLLHKTKLHDFYFLWAKDYDHAAIALGYGSLYNHASKPNAKMQMDLANNTIDVICTKDISPGEEVVFNYSDHDQIQVKLWFKEE